MNPTNVSTSQFAKDDKLASHVPLFVAMASLLKSVLKYNRFLIRSSNLRSWDYEWRYGHITSNKVVYELLKSANFVAVCPNELTDSILKYWSAHEVCHEFLKVDIHFC